MTRLIPQPAPPSFKVIFSRSFSPATSRRSGPSISENRHPEADGMIRLDFLSLLPTPLATGVIYEAQVAAVGPGGSSASARSNTFAFGMACPPSISPTSQWVPAAGITGTSTVTATTGCSWTATSNAPWITISAGAAGSGSGSVTFSVAANVGSTSRTGTMTIANETFTVTQDGAACAPSISAPSANAWGRPWNNRERLPLRPSSGCAWTATSAAAWISISAGASGTGNGSVSYMVAANPDGRGAHRYPHDWWQHIYHHPGRGDVCPDSVSAIDERRLEQAVTGSVAVTAATGCAWTTTGNAAWITVSRARGSGNGRVNFAVAANPEPRRALAR